MTLHWTKAGAEFYGTKDEDVNDSLLCQWDKGSAAERHGQENWTFPTLSHPPSSGYTLHTKWRNRENVFLAAVEAPAKAHAEIDSIWFSIEAKANRYNLRVSTLHAFIILQVRSPVGSSGFFALSLSRPKSKCSQN